MIEAMGPFLLDQVFEDVDAFALQNLDQKDILTRVLINRENETVEREKLSCDRRGRKSKGDVDLSQGSVYGAYQ